MNTPNARVALVTVALFAPFAAVAANLENPAGISIPIHELNLSPAFPNHPPQDQGVLITPKATSRASSTVTRPQGAGDSVAPTNPSLTPTPNANAKQVEAIMRNLFPPSSERRPLNPAFLAPRNTIVAPTDAELAEAQEKVREAAIQLQEATLRLQRLRVQRNAARTMQGELEPAEKPSVPRESKP